MELWEILVPVADNLGVKFHPAAHQSWDWKVMKLVDGMTILKSAKGKWYCPMSDKTIDEEMIPVRLVATRQQIECIADMTALHYAQRAVMYYKISDQVVIKYYPPDG